MTADEDLWRALLAEAIHGDDDVLEPLLETADAFEHALAAWLRDLCPGRAGAARRGRGRAPFATPSSACSSSTFPSPKDRRVALERRARELAHVFAHVSSLTGGALMTAPASRVRNRRARPHPLRPRRRPRRLPLDARERSGAPRRQERTCGSSPSTKTCRTSSASPSCSAARQGVRPKGGGADALSIVSMDDPEHAHQRRLVSRGFTPSRITPAHGAHPRRSRAS